MISSTSQTGPADGTLRILQITDTHLYADPHGRLLGQNTRRTLDLVLDAALASLDAIDLILVTGDLVHDESLEGYSYLQHRLADLEIPCYCLPGNHDDFPLMSRVFDIETTVTFHRGPGHRWNLVLLNSTIPGEDGGHLDAGQLGLLAHSLSAHPEHPTLVCLHHQPVAVGSVWMDTMALDNPQEFFGILDHHPQVRGVLWGHIHQVFAGMRNGVQLLASPSTCIQFMPGSVDFALDALTPGYRWLVLHANGEIDTGVERIAAYPDPIDLSNGGY